MNDITDMLKETKKHWEESSLDPKIKNILVLETTVALIVEDPDLQSMIVFLITAVREGETEDVAEWLSFYAKAKIENKYGKGSVNRVNKKLEEVFREREGEKVTIGEVMDVVKKELNAAGRK